MIYHLIFQVLFGKISGFPIRKSEWSWSSSCCFFSQEDFSAIKFVQMNWTWKIGQAKAWKGHPHGHRVSRHIQTCFFWKKIRFNLVQHKFTFKVHFFKQKVPKILKQVGKVSPIRFRNTHPFLSRQKLRFLVPKIGDPSSQVGNEEASKLHGSKVLFTLDGRDPFLCGQRHSGRKERSFSRKKKRYGIFWRKSPYMVIW